MWGSIFKGHCEVEKVGEVKENELAGKIQREKSVSLKEKWFSIR